MGTPPETDAHHGRDVVAILEAAERSARMGGAVELSWIGHTIAR
jgi:hypothetical protein